MNTNHICVDLGMSCERTKGADALSRVELFTVTSALSSEVEDEMGIKLVLEVLLFLHKFTTLK